MRKALIKAMKNREIICMMYIAKDNSITKRRINILNILGDTVIAYCFTRHAKRTFLIENILAVAPIQQYERKVI